jgi:hypothetical protein
MTGRGAISTGERVLGRQPIPFGLDELVAAVRPAVSEPAGWGETARLVSGELARHLPSPDVLTPEQRLGDPEGYRSHLLHAEISLQVYGTDVSRIGSSVRRYYDHPVLPAP